MYKCTCTLLTNYDAAGKSKKKSVANFDKLSNEIADV